MTMVLVCNVKCMRISQAQVSVRVKVKVKIVELRSCVPFLVHTGDSACLLFLLPKMMSSCANTYTTMCMGFHTLQFVVIERHNQNPKI